MTLSLKRYFLMKYLEKQCKADETFTVRDIHSYMVSKDLGYGHKRPEISIWSALRSTKFQAQLREVHGCEVRPMSTTSAESGGRLVVMKCIECPPLANEQDEAAKVEDWL